MGSRFRKFLFDVLREGELFFVGLVCREFLGCVLVFRI